MDVLDNLIMKRLSKKNIFSKGDLNQSMAQLGLPKDVRKTKRYKLISMGYIKRVKGGWYECLK
jgi:hypothetical protein